MRINWNIVLYHNLKLALKSKINKFIKFHLFIIIKPFYLVIVIL